MPDPHSRIANLVSAKLSRVRAMLATGEEPLPPADLHVLRGRVRDVLQAQQQVRGRCTLGTLGELLA